jgi:hypothetical protein
MESASLDLQADVVHGNQGAECFREVVRFEDGHRMSGQLIVES